MTDFPVAVIVIDAHRYFRSGIVRALNQDQRVTVIAESQTGYDGLLLIAKHRPDFALVAEPLPDLDGNTFLARAAMMAVPTRTLFMATVPDPWIARERLKHGAAGYLSKEASRSDILDAILH